MHDTEPTNIVTCSQAGERPVFIDALNLAHWCDRPPSLRLPLAVMAALLVRGDHKVVLYFDASAPYRLQQEACVYAQLQRHTAYSIEVPSGRPADRVLLLHARRAEACILSRDRFRDHRRRFRKLADDPDRVFAGTVFDHRIQVPCLGLDTALPASVEQAWTLLAPLLLLPPVD